MKELVIIGPTEFSPQVSIIVSMMEITRTKTFKIVQDLKTFQLDYVHDSLSNSIGNLLRHIAALEYSYQVMTFENRVLSKQEEKTWYGSLEGQMNQNIIKGNDLEYYLNCLNEVREKTICELKKRDDIWLLEKSIIKLNNNSGIVVNNFYNWFHVMQDEISHRGQIIWIKKRIPKKPAPITA